MTDVPRGSTELEEPGRTIVRDALRPLATYLVRFQEVREQDVDAELRAAFLGAGPIAEEAHERVSEIHEDDFDDLPIFHESLALTETLKLVALAAKASAHLELADFARCAPASAWVLDSLYRMARGEDEAAP